MTRAPNRKKGGPSEGRKKLNCQILVPKTAFYKSKTRMSGKKQKDGVQPCPSFKGSKKPLSPPCPQYVLYSTVLHLTNEWAQRASLRWLIALIVLYNAGDLTDWPLPYHQPKLNEWRLFSNLYAKVSPHLLTTLHCRPADDIEDDRRKFG